jgi:hypothetical protein
MINSRLIAQTMAITGMLGLAYLAGQSPAEEKKDLHYERIVNEDKK